MLADNTTGMSIESQKTLSIFKALGLDSTGRFVKGSISIRQKLIAGSSSKCCIANSPFFNIFLGKGPFKSIMSLSISLLERPGNRMRPVNSS